MPVKKNGAVPFYYFENLEDLNLVNHGFTTREGGVSSGPYSFLNLNYKRGDDPALVDENFRIAARVIGFDINKLAMAHADHGDKVVRIKKEINGITSPLETEKYDALVTNEKGVCISAFSADCVVIFYIDKKNKAIGISHGGWRGTLLGIPQKVINTMKNEFGTEPKNVLAGIAPSIGPCCFQVDSFVKNEFLAKLDYSADFIKPDISPGKYKIDLWGINKKTLINAGVLDENIETSEVCTMCSESFFSHRRMGEIRGGQGGFIMLK